MSEAIKIWRDTFKLNLKVGFKHDIEVTVLNLDLWKSLLTEWKEKKWNPLNIKVILNEYERRESQTKRTDATHRHQSQDCPTISPTRLPERVHRGMQGVREGEGFHFRRDSQTLEEVLTSALRKTHRA